MKCTESKYRILSFLDLTSLGVGNALGVGIFVLLGELTKSTAGPATVVSIILAGLAALMIGLCFSECGTRFVRADTAYSYSYSYHGESVAFMFGWALMLEFIAGGASVAKGIITFVDVLAENEISNFLKDIVPIKSEFGIPYLDFFSPIIIVVVVVFVSVFRLKESTIINNLFTGCTVLLLASVIVAGSTKADLNNWYGAEENVTDLEKNFAPFGYVGVLRGAAVGFYGYVGFDTMGVTGREVKNLQVCLPLANQFAICIIMVLYAGVSVILTLLNPYGTHVLGAALPFAFEKIQWITFKWILVAGSFFGFYTSLVGAPFSLFKVINAMANDGLLFRCLGNGYYSGKAPVPAIVVGTLLSVVAAGIFSFEALVRLTVTATLFASTVIAADVIMLRYVPRDETAGNASDSTLGPPVPKLDATLSEMMKLFFRFTSIEPTKLTEKIVMINLMVFCAASIGLSVVFSELSDILMDAAIEVVLPVALLLAIILINIVSITCQPKTQLTIPFKVPLIPFVPCLNMFLNILLMVLLGWLSIIHFVIWMTAGVLPHLFWYGIKYLRGDVGNNSLYEINKLNSIKLNESIWKINAEKKSFYEGAINPVFEDDNGEEMFARCVVKKNEDSSLEKTIRETDEPCQLQKVSVAEAELNRMVSEEENNEGDQWRCVAQVHTGENFLEENYEVEVVNKTYNFLSDEDYSRDEGSSTSSGAVARVINPSTGSGESVKSLGTEKVPAWKNSEASTPESSAQTFGLEKEGEKEDGRGEKRRRKRKSRESTSQIKSDNDERAKAFKDKLNILLKNQINMTNPFKDAMSNYEEEVGDEGKPESQPKNIKTLNKSQMKDTLEILLAKGPPKRYSLRNSFNVKKVEAEAADESKKQ